MPNILLFIPFYNCEKQLFRVLKQVQKHQTQFVEILLVDNVSLDNGLKYASEEIDNLQLKNVTLVRNKLNYNLGGSHKVAFNYAIEKNFSHVVVLHGDDQGCLDNIVEHIENKMFLQYDCLLGSRFHASSILIGYSKFRTFGNIVLNGFCSLVCKNIVSDMGSGLNMYSKDFFRDKRILSFPNDLTFNVYLLFHSYFTGTKLKYFPITWREEDQVSNAKVFAQFKTILRLITRCLVDPSSVYKDGKKEEYHYEIIKQV